METTDIFATKGTEYVIVVAYLVALAVFWRLTSRPRRTVARVRPMAARGWFDLPRGLFFHPGHTWVAPEGSDVLRIGMDEFSLRLLGRSGTAVLPAIGQAVRSGEPAWALEAEGETIPVLAPVQGEVLEVNEAARRSPGLVHAHPYGEGWLLKVKVRNARASLKNLLSGRPARAWMEETLERLWPAAPGGPGRVMTDGGVVVDGIARALEPDRWAEMAREFLLTSEAGRPTEGEEVDVR
jgi:glycine cleavage system H lipoate-binding protein